MAAGVNQVKPHVAILSSTAKLVQIPEASMHEACSVI